MHTIPALGEVPLSLKVPKTAELDQHGKQHQAVVTEALNSPGHEITMSEACGQSEDGPKQTFDDALVLEHTSRA